MISSLDRDDVVRNQNYVAIRCLGRGAFGEATLYRKTLDNSLVVWKEVDLSKMDRSQQEAALSEVEILASLPPHPNIVQYFTHFQSYPPEDPLLLIEMEYANGGNLQQYISRATYPLKQELVEWFLFQLCSALEHVHAIPILHRDIKSMNIFMCRSHDALLKLGDFGVSKRLDSTHGMTETVVGTPYYMSPELMQGLAYDQKSDMWACGCVLFELLTLKKSFDATNALRLAHDVVHRAIQGSVDCSVYSASMCSMVNRLLSSDPKERPTASEVLKDELFASKYKLFSAKLDCHRLGRNPLSPDLTTHSPVPTVQSSLGLSASIDSELTSSDPCAGSSVSFLGTGAWVSCAPTVSSQTSEVFMWGGGKVTPVKLDYFSNQGCSAIEVAVGSNHMAAVSIERELLTWSVGLSSSEGTTGQLGHGKLQSQRSPKVVSSLATPVIQAVCGSEFTLILSADRSIYFCGVLHLEAEEEGDVSEEESPEDYGGCVVSAGHSVYTPTLMRTEINTKVKSIACGPYHCVAVTLEGDLFAWGCGEFGRLGLGHENDVGSPTKVTIPGNRQVLTAACGSDCTLIVSSDNCLLSCGNNEFNKIGQNSVAPNGVKSSIKVGFDAPCVLEATVAKTLNGYKVAVAACGTDHSALLDIHGRVLMLGDNRCGQLGTGDTLKRRDGFHFENSVFAGKRCHKLACGDFFTVAATTANEVYAWGLASDGRLGFDVSTTPSRSAVSAKGVQVVTRPKPVFGSLHVVTGLASSHWHTVLIAERVESVKTINTDPVSAVHDPWDSTSGFDFGFSLSDDIDVGSCNERKAGDSSRDAMNESDVPDWLKMELDNADFIALDGESESNILPGEKILLKEASGSQLTNSYVKATAEVHRLRDENFKLQEIIRELQIRIDQLESSTD